MHFILIILLLNRPVVVVHHFQRNMCVILSYEITVYGVYTMGFNCNPVFCKAQCCADMDHVKPDAHLAEVATLNIKIEELKKLEGRPVSFSKWEGAGGMKDHIINETGCKPFPGVGICHRPRLHTAILRSVDNTPYYDDNLDKASPEYTLFGHNGDQDIHEKRFNEPLLNEEKTKHIYLYRVSKINKKTTWTWYGKYTISGRHGKCHVGKDGGKRNIVVLELKKCN